MAGTADAAWMPDWHRCLASGNKFKEFLIIFEKPLKFRGRVPLGKDKRQSDHYSAVQ
ncbi:MAG: hypothetical protein QFF03_17360 [Pseudomonadota bacterium]|nr:hypothetical protein [Pseudomonadota bacterium]